jgi:hypothetical protein
MWDQEGKLYFPIKPSCAYLGIDYDTSLDTIKADSRLTPGLELIKLPTTGNANPQSMQCLRKLEYTWWLSLLDPRRFREERRSRIIERQRILMEFAEEVILHRGDMRLLRDELARRRTTVEPDVRGAMEAHFRCLRCGAPHVAIIDGNGWQLHLGVEAE